MLNLNNEKNLELNFLAIFASWIRIRICIILRIRIQKVSRNADPDLRHWHKMGFGRIRQINLYPDPSGSYSIIQNLESTVSDCLLGPSPPGAGHLPAVQQASLHRPHHRSQQGGASHWRSLRGALYRSVPQPFHHTDTTGTLLYLLFTPEMLLFLWLQNRG